jgi:tRNA G18 (ribose-2'-O)-methylase SpoU
MTNKTRAGVQLVHQQTQWKKHSFPITIACDNWQDPRNVGMAFRLAEAFGVQSLWLGGSTPVPPNQKIKRASRSTYQRIPYIQQADLKAALLEAKTAGQRIIGIEITSNSSKLGDVATRYYNQKNILVLGAEKQGISEDILSIVDACAHIPMYGDNSSLNVATALAVSLYAWTEALNTLKV